MKLKSWRNGPGGRWTARIEWHEMSGGKIRLECYDNGYEHNFYTTNEEEADRIWNLFRQSAKTEGFLEEMIEMMRSIDK